MSNDDYGNVLIGLAGDPVSMQSVVSFLRESDDARVISGKKLLSLSETPSGLTLVPDMKSFKEKNHLLGVRGYLIWCPAPGEKPSATDKYRSFEFYQSDCHWGLEFDGSWRRKLSALLAALQFRSVE